ncbi:MAG: HRDC domain-containing protein [Malacoplasma sp.]|nr:HRDC domain-containing protein [Malacoplasma sp.]
MLLIFYLAIPQWREFLPSIFTISTTMAVAILTIMGVHYNIAKQQLEKNDRKNLIFALSEEETANNFDIRNSLGNQTIQLKLKNISDNFGYIIGLYRICGCDAHQIGDELPYFPIRPQTTYSISNIKLNFGDDQLIIVYTDISNNFYYLLISSNYQYIESAGKCDMDFLNWRLDMTEKSEQKSKNKLFKQKSTEQITDEEFILRRKEETKPNNTIRENGFDLIISSDGSISTDINLLNKLKKERIRIAKEQKVKAYMVFNNQQLVAMATYKPHDELSFISIYGLGKKKFELYGEIFLPIIAEHNSTTH